MKHKIGSRFPVRTAIAIGVLSAASLSCAYAAPPADAAEAQAREGWRTAIALTEVPGEGCFHASYPSMTWNKIDCVVAPNVPFVPRRSSKQTVGDGDDYAAEVTGLMTEAIGEFPVVKGVTSETDPDGLGANDYSLQLNSNFMSTAACDGATIPADCLAWQQFVYSSGYTEAFMQYWLINYNSVCPAGWYTYENDCYTNSAAVGVPDIAITDLEYFKLEGKAVQGGNDTLKLTTESEAYSTTGSDSVVDLATAWTESEFNVIGDGNGSEADFNTGSEIRIRTYVYNGTTNVPTCAADAGTTGETNNLTLHTCSGKGGAHPYITFVESN